jgi:hypothetical protein
MTGKYAVKIVMTHAENGIATHIDVKIQNKYLSKGGGGGQDNKAIWKNRKYYSYI